MGVDLLHQHQPCSGGACGRHNARARHARPPTLEACRAPPPPGAMAAQAPIAIKEALLVRARRRRRRRRRRCGGGGAYGARGARARFFFRRRSVRASVRGWLRPRGGEGPVRREGLCALLGAEGRPRALRGTDRDSWGRPSSHEPRSPPAGSRAERALQWRRQRQPQQLGGGGTWRMQRTWRRQRRRAELTSRCGRVRDFMLRMPASDWPRYAVAGDRSLGAARNGDALARARR